MENKLFSFEIIDLSEIVGLSDGMYAKAHDGCGTSEGKCMAGCGCGQVDGNCGGYKPVKDL